MEIDHIPDKTNTPVLALVALRAEDLDVEACVTTVGPNRPRTQQNLVFLLVPETVHVTGDLSIEEHLLRAQEVRNQLEDLGRTVLAMRQLKDRPENHGITAAMLQEQDFETTLWEREHALVTTVTQAYTRLWFPSAAGQLVSHEIKTAGGEGGAPVIETIRGTLSDAGELLTAERATTQETLLSLATLFFEVSQTPTLEKLRERFACDRRWPVLEEATLLEKIVRAGVAQGYWCLFRMGSAERTEPEHCFSRESGDLPLDLDLTASGWSLVTVQGARQRGWIGAIVVDPDRVARWVAEAIAEGEATYVSEVVQRVVEQHGEVPQPAILEAVDTLVQADRAITFRGTPNQEERPGELIHGASSILHRVRPDDVVIAPAVAATRGWVAAPRSGFQLAGRDGAQQMVPLLARIGSLYMRGARSTIATLDLVDLEVSGGGRLRLTLEDVPPEAMKRLGELLEVLARVIQSGPNTEGFLEIRELDEKCPFLQALRRTPP